MAPEYSPDGKRIVFASDRMGSFDIWVCDSEGFNPVQLTFDFKAGSPRWSPDGQRIAFDSFKEAGHSEIYVVNADGGLLRRLTTGNVPSVMPTWSRDGRWIYFCSEGSERSEVWKMPSEGGPPIQVTKSGGRLAFESPDRKFIFYGGRQGGGVWRVSADGGEETRVIDHFGWKNWVVLNQGIYLLNPATTPLPAIEFFSFAKRPVERVAVLPREVLPIFNSGNTVFSISPDGGWIIYARADRSESEIDLVENFR